MLKGRLNGDYCLCDDVLDVLPETIDVEIRLVVSDVVPDGGHASLVAARVVVLVLVEYEVVAVFLNGVVSQVHVKVVQVAVLRPHVLLGCESSQALLVYEDAQGVDPVDESVNAQIEL